MRLVPVEYVLKVMLKITGDCSSTVLSFVTVLDCLGGWDALAHRATAKAVAFTSASGPVTKNAKDGWCL